MTKKKKKNDQVVPYPYQIECRFSFQIVNQDGSKIDSFLKVAPACGMFSAIQCLSLWSSGRKIRSWENYNLLQHVVTLFQADKSWIESLGYCEGFYPDSVWPEGEGWILGANSGATYGAI